MARSLRLILACLAAGAASLGLPATPGRAHHSFDLAFDRDRELHLEGTVTGYVLASPHSYLTLAVAGADGTAIIWHIETTTGDRMRQIGWTESTFAPGEQLTVDGWPARDGHPYLRIRSIARADGSEVAVWPTRLGARPAGT